MGSALLALLAAASALTATEAPPGSTGPGTDASPASQPSAAAAPAAPAEPSTPPRALALPGDGWLRPGALLQVWGLASQAPGQECNAPACVATQSTFRVRRAQIEGHGELLNGLLAFRFSFDPARPPQVERITVPVEPPGSGAVTVSQPKAVATGLLDLFLTARTPLFDFTAGQFRIPVSLEGSGSSGRLLFPERSLVSREYGDRRDVGVRLSKTWTHLSYTVALVNGRGAGAVDEDNAKDLGVRLDFKPLPGLLVGLVGYGTLGGRGQVARDRAEIDLRLERGPLLVQAELIRGRDRAAGTEVHSFGFYVAGGMRLSPKLQAVARGGHFDPLLGRDALPGQAGGADELDFYEAGLNYYARGDQAKLQLALTRLQYQQRPAGTELVAALQLSF